MHTSRTKSTGTGKVDANQVRGSELCGVPAAEAAPWKIASGCLSGAPKFV